MVRIRDQRWRVVAHVVYQEAALLRVVGSGADNEGLEAQFLLPYEHVEPLPSVHEPEVVRATGWRRIARLELSEDEISRFQEQLSDILEAVSKVSELDLSDVPPTSHPLEIANAWAEDEPHASLTLDEAFANAPDRDDDLFRVPPA